jgi:hypothetical protein
MQATAKPAVQSSAEVEETICIEGAVSHVPLSGRVVSLGEALLPYFLPDVDGSLEKLALNLRTGNTLEVAEPSELRDEVIRDDQAGKRTA